MKKIFGLIVVFTFLLVVLSACSLNGIPSDAVTVGALFHDIRNENMNTLKVIEYHKEYLVVELNGNKHTVIPDPDKSMNITHIGNFGFNNTPIFLKFDLFDVKTWNFDKDSDPTLEYYVFINGLERMDFRSINPASETELVLIHKNGMPNLVDARKWNNTQATLVSWEYPNMYPFFQIVQNMDTNEIAFSTGAELVDKAETRYYFIQGAVWGYIYTLNAPPSNGEFQTLYIKQLPTGLK